MELLVMIALVIWACAGIICWVLTGDTARIIKAIEQLKKDAP
jgi:hypothetical protein